MELRRTLLIIAMAVVGYFLMINWQKDYGHTASAPAATASLENESPSDMPVASAASTEKPKSAGDVPVAPVTTDVADVAATPTTTATKRPLIAVRTDVLDLRIDLQGGDIVRAALPTYTESVDSKNAFALLESTAQRNFVAQSGLIGANGPDASAEGRPLYHAESSSFSLAEGQKNLQVVLSLPAQNGVLIRKIYELDRGSYLIKVRYEVANQGTQDWQGLLFGQLKRDNSKDPSAASQGFGISTFLGGAWWSPEKSYNKVKLNDFAEKPLKETVTGGWAAFVQHYFVTAWVPEKKSSNTFTTRVNKATGENFIGFTAAPVSVAPGQTKSLAAELYVGPKIQKELKKISDGLELTVDFGWLWFIAQGLFWLLSLIHSLVGNWGWAIVLLTILVKAAFFQLSATSYKSMAHMRRVTPEIQRIREQYSNDRAKMSQAMMDLYKKEKINPLGGCLPILVQMPVFIALYWTLMESVELRHAPWIFWIHDLSMMDPYFILPLIMGGSMFLQFALNPAPPDPMQAKIMKMMPIVFTFMFLWFPSGLVLYWVVNNILSIAQQWVITRQIEKTEGKRT
jgi:YidC/Oxa1 family membrane protein insertase